MVKEQPVVEEIQANLYRIEVPIPKNPLKALNSYVVKGEERNLIIDTGVNHEDAADAMLSSLERLGIDLNRTDFFATHLHVDHLGMVKRLGADSSKLFYNGPEAACVNSDKHWQAIYSWQEVYLSYLRHGFPKAKLEKTIRAYPGYDYATGKDIEIVILKEGDVISVGEYSLRCVETPGHSPGHMCLYEEGSKLLFSGDHLLFDVTPNVGSMVEDENSLEKYLASLDKLIPLEVRLVLPAHKRVFSDHRKRIEELKQHHEDRLNEILSVLEKGEQNAYQIVSQVEWQIDCGSWERLPFLHKFASFGETIAHLKYLEGQGRIQRKERQNKVSFSLNGHYTA